MTLTSRLCRRSVATIAAATLAFSGFAAASPAIAEPAEAPERDSSERAGAVPSSMWLDEFADDTARLDRDALIVTPAASPIIEGRLEFRLLDNSTEPVVDGLVRFWREGAGGRYEMVSEVNSFGPNGEFSRSLLAGTYRVEFITFDPVGGGRTYWQNAPVFFAATDIEIADDESVDFDTVIIEPRQLNFFRVAGDDRFATAVELAQGVFEEGGQRAPVVYIVDAFNFADALSAGPAAAIQGGLLLPVRPNSIPDVIKAELTRLNPERIVIAGGTGAVSAAVQTELANYVDHPSHVERVGGIDRYATSRAIVADAFGDVDVNEVFIATGRDFPDALAAGPAAAHFGGAVLLVDGAAASVPTETLNLISSFDEPYVFLAGGTGVINTAVANALAGPAGGQEFVIRLGGIDRFETARLINQQVFGFTESYPDFAFIANAYGFADALAAGPVAAAYGAPLYLSAPQCLRSQTWFDLVDLLVTFVFPVGGTGVLSDAVLSAELC